MKKLIFIIALSILPFSIIQADVRWFVGGGGGFVSFESSPEDPELIDLDVSPGNAYLRGGLSVNEYFDFGAEYSFSLIEDDFYGWDTAVDIFSLYAKGNLLINDDFKLYGLVTSSDVEVTFSSTTIDNVNVTASVDDDDIGFGFGFEYAIDKSLSLSADYINYYDEEDTTVDALNIGVVHRF